MRGRPRKQPPDLDDRPAPTERGAWGYDPLPPGNSISWGSICPDTKYPDPYQRWPTVAANENAPEVSSDP